MEPGSAAAAVLQVCGWATAASLAALLLPLIGGLLFPRRLGAITSAPRECPELTVVVPARDEERAIGEALRSLLALDYPRLSIVAVDDRSRDGTGSIMDELSGRDRRLHTIHVETLPPGWLGKNHANWLGASRAGSGWILFTDGDVIFEPGTVKGAIDYAEREGIDHLTLVPGMVRGGFWECLMVDTFSLMFGIRFPPWLARTRLKSIFLGIGAFNLISLEAYRRIGTHRRLALEVADDIKLGKLVKVHGLRQDVLDGTRAIRVRWQVGMRGVINGLTKNAFAGFDYSLFQAVAASSLYVLAFLFPYLAVACAPRAAGAGFAAALVLLHAGFAAALLRNRSPLWSSLFLPLSLALFLFTIWRAIAITLRRGGVVWRDTFYPLAELRKGVV